MWLTRPWARLGLIAACAGILFTLAAILLPHSPSALSHWMGGHGWLAAGVFAALWAALTPAMFSGTVLAAAAGLLFGAALGTAVGIAGATLGGLLSFGISRRWGAAAFGELTSKRGARVRAVQARVDGKPFRAVLALRLMPGMPVTWLNYALGLTRVRAATFAAASALGGAPRIFIYAGLGGAASHPSSILTICSIALYVVLGAVGVVVAIRERRALRATALASAV